MMYGFIPSGCWADGHPVMRVFYLAMVWKIATALGTFFVRPCGWADDNLCVIGDGFIPPYCGPQPLNCVRFDNASMWTISTALSAIRSRHVVAFVWPLVWVRLVSPCYWAYSHGITEGGFVLPGSGR